MSGKIRDGIIYLSAALLCATALTACSGDREPVEAVIALQATTDALKSATIVVDYSQSAASPLASSSGPACTSLLPHVDTTFADDGQGTLTIKATTTASFSGPSDIAVCRMVPATDGVAGNAIAARLRVSMAGGTTAAGKRVEPTRMADARGGARQPAGGRAGDTASAEPGTVRGANPGTAAARAATGAATGSAGAETGRAGGGTGMVINRPGGGSDAPRAQEQPTGRRETHDLADTGSGSANRESGIGTSGGRSTGDTGDTGNAADDDGGDQGDEDANDETDFKEVAAYLVQVGVTSDSGTLGALQFDIEHLGSSGGWQGAGASVNCRFDVAAGLTQCNDKGSGRLTCALVDVSGFDTPAAIVTCTFKSGDAVTAGDFSVSVKDASDTGLNPADVSMGVLDLVRR